MASNAIFIVTLCIIASSFMIIWKFSGFDHETRKFKAILVAFMLAMLFQFLIFDPLRFLVLAIDAACWPKLQRPLVPDPKAKRHTRMDYLNLRLRSLRSQLMITSGHRNEELNLKYRTIVRELWVYGKLFLIHLFLNLAMLNRLLYYNGESITNLLKYNHTDSIGQSHVLFLHQVYPFIEHTLLNGFLSNDHHRKSAHWNHVNSTKLLGVIQMRLLRDSGEHYGLNEPKYTDKEYSEGWSLPHVREPYTNKYWSIYLPWLPMSKSHSFWERFFLSIRQHGYFATYPEMKGYAVTLRNTRDDSMKVLTYLYENNWLDNRTAAFFLDFTLYNVDANIFSVVTLRFENLPYGIIHSSMYVNSVSLTETMETLPWIGMICLFAYAIIWLELGMTVIVPLWFEPKRLRTFWVKVDLLILMLSMIVVTLMALREGVVSKLLAVLEMASTHDFIDFRIPARMTELTVILMGFLICLVTLRLWKVMQFASIFQIFTKTLSLAWQALFSTACVICIFMCAFGIATVCINGNNNDNFRTLLQGMATVMCFSFGFTSHVAPSDLFNGGIWLGILIYGIMAFTIAILLTNVFVSILNNYFTAAKAVRDRNRKDQITFWDFLSVEYADTINTVREAFGCERKYRRKNRTVAENIKRKMDLQAAAVISARVKRGRSYRSARERKGAETEDEAEENERKAQAQHIDRISRTYTIAAILQTQMEIAERRIFGDKDGNLHSDDESVDSAMEQDLPRQYV
ncbi:polycystin-2 [Drosophila subobscura]|uniref:polycystin-2 n=1 Tax=Drosophila subobscura TaxID=7241 RepID=UPI00155A2EA0|nr:polycystin-2 [Drosophila subobscura]